jgi:hypothetical protein
VHALGDVARACVNPVATYFRGTDPQIVRLVASATPSSYIGLKLSLLSLNPILSLMGAQARDEERMIRCRSDELVALSSMVPSWCVVVLKD